ncbi:helix-turn-helix domain-containing protein [Nocardioides jensenii]|uniref:helix-turn-helix domain-containing protein n=1 Tax=Nocardioides jensenii TaxID=1843 RepID=UPI00082DF592|nr:helix-turn-helix domain-containing protein [Nocardioides jensenii]
MSLEAAGLGPAQENVYRLLVRVGEAPAEHVAEVLGLPEDDVRRLLADLQAVGLVTTLGSGPRRYAPTPPDVGFAPLLRQGVEALDRARITVNELTDEHRASIRRRDANQLVEVISGTEAIRQQLRNLQLSTRSEMLWFCRAGVVAMPSADNDEEFAMLARGVSYRVIYEQELLEEPGMIDSLAQGVRAGEVARAAPSLPVRMAISDRSIALCPLVPGRDGISEPTAALVRDSNLLTALLALFDSYWSGSSPLLAPPDPHGTALVEGSPTDPLADETRALLSLLVAGVSDKAIATRLGMSVRTVQRRISEVMALTHAQTRMQLAWQVSRRGWLEGTGPGDVGPFS